MQEEPRSRSTNSMLTGLQARDHCTRLLAEDPRREVRRSELKEERDNIVQAQEKLASLTDPQE